MKKLRTSGSIDRLGLFDDSAESVVFVRPDLSVEHTDWSGRQLAAWSVPRRPTARISTGMHHVFVADDLTCVGYTKAGTVVYDLGEPAIPWCLGEKVLLLDAIRGAIHELSLGANRLRRNVTPLPFAGGFMDWVSDANGGVVGVTRLSDEEGTQLTHLFGRPGSTIDGVCTSVHGPSRLLWDGNDGIVVMTDTSRLDVEIDGLGGLPYFAPDGAVICDVDGAVSRLVVRDDTLVLEEHFDVETMRWDSTESVASSCVIRLASGRAFARFDLEGVTIVKLD